MRTIKSSADIDKVFQQGTHFNSKKLSIITYASDLNGRDPSGRVAFIAGRRLGNAVVRNRNKRVLRAAAYEAGLPVEGYDVVLIANRGTSSSPHDELVSSLRYLLRKSGLQ